MRTLHRMVAQGDPGLRRAEAARAGFSLLEVVLASAVLAVLLLATALSLGENVDATQTSESLTNGAVFLESVEEDLASLNGAELLAMNGQSVFSSADPARADFQCVITVFNSTVSLLQVELRLVDLGTGRDVATVHTLRALT